MRLKLTKKTILRLSVTMAVLLWLILTLIELLWAFSVRNGVDLGISSEVPQLALDLFFVALIIYYQHRISRQESGNFVDLLWRVFAIGLVTTIISLALLLFYQSVESTKLGEILSQFMINENLNFALSSIFLISTFTVWKRLILYQRSKRLVIYWNIFEATLIASIFFNLTGQTLQGNLLFQIAFGGLALMALLLSGNLKWVAYLNFKQKWKSILLILLVTIYLVYFFSTIYIAPAEEVYYFESFNNLFVLTLYAFLLFYGIFSLLVILFNLPTTSVFEQKMEEAINFQRLSQSIQQGENETQIFDILLNSSMNAVYAEAAWLEIDREGDVEIRSKHISRINIKEIKCLIEISKHKNVLRSPLAKPNENDRMLVNLKRSNYRSVLVVPLSIQNKISGRMYLLKEVTDGFNKEMIDIINTFANQASISVENFRLLGEALENERYKEELNIAKNVQRALLPTQLDHDKNFEIHAFSKAAAEVGGDYYDTFQLGENKFAVVIGDVSGKGTSAAFHMSQMKGIFQSLVQLDLPAKDFLVHANTAISKCLERTSFITLSYFIIDTAKRTIEFARAGHCPTLYYCKKENASRFFTNKGLGLGILRNDHFADHIHVNHMEFAKDDIAILYTDGISEASNEAGDEFGYDRMKKILDQNWHYDPIMIQKVFISKLYEFCGNKDLNDDYTMVVIKFK